MRKVKRIVVGTHGHMGKETKGESLPNTKKIKPKKALRKSTRPCDDEMASG